MSPSNEAFHYPRRVPLRKFLSKLALTTFKTLADFQVEGQENIPATGPYLVVGNHFSHADPAAIVAIIPEPLDFLGGFEMPNAPNWVKGIPKVWGYYPVFRGSVNSRYALRAAKSVLKQNGVVGIFPEGGSWIDVLRPARPGTAFLATQTGSPLLPVGLDGLTDIFSSLKRGRRAKIRVRIGPTFGPFKTTERGQKKRQQLDEFGHEIMRQIAKLIPPERRGHYSDDPAIREAAKGSEEWPWDTLVEGSE